MLYHIVFTNHNTTLHFFFRFRVPPLGMCTPLHGQRENAHGENEHDALATSVKAKFV